MVSSAGQSATGQPEVPGWSLQLDSQLQVSLRSLDGLFSWTVSYRSYISLIFVSIVFPSNRFLAKSCCNKKNPAQDYQIFLVKETITAWHILHFSPTYSIIKKTIFVSRNEHIKYLSFVSCIVVVFKARC